MWNITNNCMHETKTLWGHQKNENSTGERFSPCLKPILDEK